MLIGELARNAGCDGGTIRYYEREGLLEKPYRSPAGYRTYTDAHLMQLNFILRCRALGMPLAEIKTLQRFQANPNAPCAGISDLIDRQIQRIKEQIKVLHTLETQLSELRSSCHTITPVSECCIMKTLTTSDKPGGTTPRTSRSGKKGRK